MQQLVHSKDVLHRLGIASWAHRDARIHNFTEKELAKPEQAALSSETSKAIDVSNTINNTSQSKPTAVQHTAINSEQPRVSPEQLSTAQQSIRSAEHTNATVTTDVVQTAPNNALHNQQQNVSQQPQQNKVNVYTAQSNQNIQLTEEIMQIQQPFKLFITLYKGVSIVVSDTVMNDQQATGTLWQNIQKALTNEQKIAFTDFSFPMLEDKSLQTVACAQAGVQGFVNAFMQNHKSEKVCFIGTSNTQNPSIEYTLQEITLVANTSEQLLEAEIPTVAEHKLVTVKHYCIDAMLKDWHSKKDFWQFINAK